MHSHDQAWVSTYIFWYKSDSTVVECSWSASVWINHLPTDEFQITTDSNLTKNARKKISTNEQEQWKYAVQIVAKDLRATLEHTEQTHEPNYANEN